jgi:ketosteroid isomerase-like protein
MPLKHLVLIVSFVGLNTACAAEPQSSASAPAESGNLTEEITRMDAKMFDAFNSHDVDRLMSLFTEDLEFYHDKGGLTTSQQTSEGFGRMFGNAPDIKRTLVPGTLQIYPIKDYGAIELGTHRFCHKENGKDDCGNFPFVMVWKKVGDSWKVSRVISYGH